METLQSNGSETEPKAAMVSTMRGGGPRIYVACLADCHEAGQQSVRGTDCSPNDRLYGRWIEADQTASEIWTGVCAMLKASPVRSAERWAIHDYQGFGPAEITQQASFEHVSRLAEFFTLRGEALGGALLTHFDGDLDAANAAFEDYAGCFESLAVFMEDLTEETTEIPEILRGFVDYQAMARDAEQKGRLITFETGPKDVHIFWRV